ncbi:MAG TPA: efflux transporter outer membrane subunit [Terriglobia bacterium]|nr:efflux transporter outer membrane subunit [Terriglobia bacterium]
MKCYRRSILIPAVLFLLSGCNIGPKYRRPAVATPASFRAAPAADAADPQSIADQQWFEVFKDAQLQNLIRTALAQNYQLRIAMARVEAARANLGIRRSDQYPSINAGGAVIAVQPTESGVVPLPSALTPTGINHERTFGTTFLDMLSYELDIWGKVRRSTEAARDQLFAMDWNRKAVMTTLVADVASAYFNLLEQDRELEIAKDTLATRRESLGLIERRQTHGSSTLLDVRQAEQLVSGATQTITNAEREIEQTENQISLLIGGNPGAVQRGRLLDQQSPPTVPTGLPADLLVRRPDIQAAEHFLMAANANIGVARTFYLPSITLTGLYGYASADLSNLISGSQKLWLLTPFISQSVFNAGRTRSGVHFTEALERDALNEYMNAVQTGFRDVSDGLVQYKRVREIRDERESLVKTLQDRKRLAYMRYRGGVDTMVNALNSDQDLFVAELSLAQSTRDELLSLVQLYKALGGGWK